MFLSRVIFATLLVLVISAALCLDMWLESYVAFTAVFGFFVVMATAEFFTMAKRAGHTPFTTLGVVTAGALVTGYWADQHFAHHGHWVYVVAFGFILALFVLQGFASPRKAGVVSVALTVFGVFYIWVLAGFIQRMSYLEGVNPKMLETFRYWGVIVFLMTVKSSDIGAYLVGKFIGKHHPFPKISPGKSIEGYAAGLMVSMAVGAVSGTYILGVYAWYWWAAFGAMMWLFGSMGDLFESIIKRDLGAKDSGKLIPGLGGVFDQLDSVLLAGPAAYIWLASMSSWSF